MYSIVRIIIGFLLLSVPMVLVAKSKARHKQRRVVGCVLLALAITIVLSFVPFENAIVTFPSAESAARYYDMKFSNTQEVVEGLECDMVVARKSKNSYSQTLVPKTNEGWKIGLGTDIKIISQKTTENATITVYGHQKLSDRFIWIKYMDDEEPIIAHSIQTEFVVLQKEELGDLYLSVYCANITQTTEAYRVYINGKEIAV